MCDMDTLITTHSDIYDNNFQMISAQGIGSLGFHYWVAHNIIAVDPSFSYMEKIGRGFQAQEINAAARQWVAKLSAAGALK